MTLTGHIPSPEAGQDGYDDRQTALRLLSFGSNSLGQLSHGSPALEDAHTPVEVGLPTPVSDITIVAGGNHTFLLSSSILWSAGDNSFGQCGIPQDADAKVIKEPGRPDSVVILAFTQVPPLDDGSSWQVVSAGWQFSILLSSDGRLYSCGNGPRGELGLGADTGTSTQPAIIEGFPPASPAVKRIVSGVEHTLALLSNGEVYGWGNGRKGQLGEAAAKKKFLWTPTLVQLGNADFRPVDIAAGREFSAFISQEGEVHVIGNNKWNVISSNPLIKNPGWKGVGAGWGAIYVLNPGGKVTSWGRNTHGQLPPDGLPDLDKLAVGSEHAIGVGQDGKIYIWGWGEHGNCGPLKEGQGEVVRWTNEVSMQEVVKAGYKVEGIAAGCATSWVWVSEVSD